MIAATEIRTPLATEIRDAMEGLAVKHLNGQVEDGWVEIHLMDRRPDLNVWDRWALWEDLTTAYQAWSDSENPDVEINWDEIEPELRHPVVYAEKMRAALDEQLDTLVDGYVARTADGR